MIIKRNVIFWLEKRKKNGIIVEENMPISMRLTFNGTRINFSTGFRIDASKWDEQKQRVKNGCTNKAMQSLTNTKQSCIVSSKSLKLLTQCPQRIK